MSSARGGAVPVFSRLLRVPRREEQSINKQIGNAVAPLLAYRSATTQGPPGVFVDLFAGAGGLSLGFQVGRLGDRSWRTTSTGPRLRRMPPTSTTNVSPGRHPRADGARRALMRACAGQHAGGTPDVPFLVLGGPPCQGFSTAGRRRSMDDERNHLFHDYRAVVDALRPDGFVFENVTGLLEHAEGSGLPRGPSTCSARGWRDIRGDVVRAEHYGVRAAPVARRRRRAPRRPRPAPPASPCRTCLKRTAERSGLAVTPGAEAAIGDLPPLNQGEDGSARRVRARDDGLSAFLP